MLPGGRGSSANEWMRFKSPAGIPFVSLATEARKVISNLATLFQLLEKHLITNLAFTFPGFNVLEIIQILLKRVANPFAVP